MMYRLLLSIHPRRRKQIESGGTNKSAGKIFYCAPHFYAVPPSLRGHCSHQGGHKDVQSYCLCVKNWSVDNSVQLWINYIIIIRNLMLKYVKIVKVLVAKIAVVRKLTTLAYVGTTVFWKSLLLTDESLSVN